MFCEKCGKELPDDAAFCDNCGTPVAAPEQPQSAAQPPLQDAQTQPEAYAAQSAPQSSGPSAFQLAMAKVAALDRRILAAILAVAAVLLALILYFALRAPRVNLDDFIDVEYSGFDSMGTAYYTFDTEAFCEKYGDKIKYQDKTAGALAQYLDKEEIVESMVYSHISGELSKDSELSNGDEITFTWDCDDEEVQKTYGVKLVYKDLTFTVEGLEAVTTVDPFEDVEVQYSGVAPVGYAEVVVNSDADYAWELYYTVSPDSGLSNGSTVTVSIDPNWNDQRAEYFLANYGVTFAETSKTYTVEGLPSYLSAISQIPEDVLSSMQERSVAAIQAQAARSWSDSVTLAGSTYLGGYLLCGKDGYSSPANMLYLIYQVDVSSDQGEDGVHTGTYYAAVRYQDIIAATDGSVTVDLGDYQLMSDNCRLELGERTYWFAGFASLDDAFKECVTKRVDNYSYESTVGAQQ